MYFEPYIEIAEQLSSADPAHDVLHVKRVFKNGQAILEKELEADEEVVLTAILLHELINLPKDHPFSSRSGDLCAELAGELLETHQFPIEKREAVLTCIRHHSFSKGIVPKTIEEKIVQDADRLDAMGAIGIARCFATSAAMKRPFYQEKDPFSKDRGLDGKGYAVDHFYQKLLRLGDAMHTEAAKGMAQSRLEFMNHYLDQLDNELG
ncbi:HD domain-containing protein [Pullulanibacillus sp. KACC 23026]|uniref:HD domain-containing protein n=1 Tax=Pullulanibacillus sp. KACC 23026 TaxID=3028315 RepID=UPI0023B18E27|nr:HD domain-containing protein [Pullulanibacillus sp. KACC 23026]WEG14386.1 HD domain-containing protein [Pullulanibacillus sp. KACC 23026]